MEFRKTLTIELVVVLSGLLLSYSEGFPTLLEIPTHPIGSWIILRLLSGIVSIIGPFAMIITVESRKP